MPTSRSSDGSPPVRFDESRAVSLTGLADAVAARAAGDPAPLLALLHPLDEVWREFPTIVVKDSAASALAHGAGLARGGIVSLPKNFSRGARVALVNRGGELIATGVARHDASEMGGAGHGWVVEETRVFVDPERFPALWHEAPAARSKSPGDARPPR